MHSSCISTTSGFSQASVPAVKAGARCKRSVTGSSCCNRVALPLVLVSRSSANWGLSGVSGGTKTPEALFPSETFCVLNKLHCLCFPFLVV